MHNYHRIHHIALTISDYDRSVNWYRDVLGLERVYPEAELKNPVFIAHGPVILALFKSGTDKPSPKPEQSDSLIVRHFALCVDVPGFDSARTRLDERNIDFRFADHSGQTPKRHSIYFCDPSPVSGSITSVVVPA